MGEWMGQSSNPPMQNYNSEINNIEGQTGGLMQAGQGSATWMNNTLYPQMQQQEMAQTNAQQANQVGVLKGGLGQGFQGALGQLSPLYSQGQNAIGGLLATNGQQTGLQANLQGQAMNAGPSALTNQLTGQAQQELALGANLSPDQQRQVTQATDAGFNSRGIVGSNPAIFSEALNADQFGQQLLQQRQGFAGQVNEQGLANQAQNQQFQMGVNQQQQGALGQAEGFALNAQQAGQQALAPVLGFSGQQAAVQPGMAAGVMNAGTNAMSSAYDPLLSYGSNMYDWNYNAQAATLLNNANNMAAINGAVIGAIGSAAGGAMAGCWVAREVLGTQSTWWTWFRQWMIEDAPVWFYAVYFRYGERFAAFIHDKPLLKRWMRPWMEKVAFKKLYRMGGQATQEMVDIWSYWRPEESNQTIESEG